MQTHLKWLRQAVVTFAVTFVFFLLGCAPGTHPNPAPISAAAGGIDSADLAQESDQNADPGHQADDSDLPGIALADFNASTPQWSRSARITEAEAMEIAMIGLDPDAYQATSAIYGPIPWNGEEIPAYAVTVASTNPDADHLRMAYVNARDGVLLYDEEHQIPVDPDWDDWMEELPADAHAAYYPSCPGSWYLCIPSIYFYSQNDPSWNGNRINGTSGYTIGGGGCVISTIAMDLRQDGVMTRNPGSLNSWLDAYNNFGGCSGSTADESSADTNFSCVDADVAGVTFRSIGVHEVWSRVAAGEPVMVYGDLTTGRGSCHMQLIYGHDGSRFWTKDPWYDWTNQDQPMRVYTGYAACTGAGSYRVFE